MHDVKQSGNSCSEPASVRSSSKQVTEGSYPIEISTMFGIGGMDPSKSKNWNGAFFLDVRGPLSPDGRVEGLFGYGTEHGGQKCIVQAR